MILIFSFFELSASSVTVKGKFANAENFKKVYLYQYLGTHLSKIDSTKLKRGKFSFILPANLVRGFYKIGVNQDSSITLILGREKLFLEADLDDLDASLTIQDSKENALYQKYEAFHRDINNARAKSKEKQNADSINRVVNTFHAEMKQNNQGLFMAELAGIFMTKGSHGLDTFFGLDELTNPELTRGSMLVSKIIYYFQKFVPKELETYKEHANKLLEKTPENSDSRQVAYMALIQMFRTAAIEQASIYAKRYAHEFPEEVPALELLGSLPKAPPEIGDLAPEISLEGTDGEILSLSSLKGKVILLDFWASWCGPCRRENPNVVRIFNKYKDLGFDIFGVSLDKSKEKWLAAIEKDGLIWGHVSDLLGWSNVAAADYRVSAIPATFLIDENGYIIAKNLRGKKLEKALAEYFNNN